MICIWLYIYVYMNLNIYMNIVSKEKFIIKLGINEDLILIYIK